MGRITVSSGAVLARRIQDTACSALPASLYCIPIRRSCGEECVAGDVRDAGKFTLLFPVKLICYAYGKCIPAFLNSKIT
jgi:hypothetical protein